jgi:RND family efflux transporter MFP subunit
MKKLIYLALIFFLAACAASTDKQSQGDDEILERISEYKKEIGELNDKIIELEKQLSANSGTDNAIAVATQTLNYEPFNHYIEVSGVVEARNSAFISPEINGQIKEIYVVEGERVKKGDKLIRLNSSITENTIVEVETSLELAQTVYNKQKELWEKNIGSEIDYLQAKNNVESLKSRLETLKSQLELTEIEAPISGIIDEIYVKEGELAIPGVQLIQLVNLNDLYINADVSESYISDVREGEPVLLEFPSYPDISMKVPVHRTGNVIKQANRTFRVQLKIENEKERIKPNALAKIRINDYSEENALLVPSIIIKQDMKGTYLYKVDPSDQTAIKVYVKTGRTYQDKSMITSGLSEGDQIIVSGYNQVSNGSKVKISG